MIKKILTTLIFILIYITSNAQWTSNTALNTTVRDQAGSNEVTPLMVTINNGFTYVSWFQPVAGTNYELRMQLIDQYGVGQWGAAGLLVSSFPQNSALFRYDLKTDNDGNAIVAFQDERTGQLDAVAYKLNMNGNQLWGSNGISLPDPSSTFNVGPTIGILNNNDVIISWSASSGSARWINYQRISATGTIVWPSLMKILDIANTKKFTKPSIVPYGNDEFMMLYSENVAPNSSPGTLKAQRFDTNGSSVWSTPVTVSNYTIPSFFFPVAISDNNDGMFVSFNTSNPSSPAIGLVYVQHVRANGSLWNPTGVSASQLANSHHFTPGALFDSINQVVFVLIKTTDIAQGQSGVYVQKIDTAGTILWNLNAVQVAPVQAAYNDPHSFSITPTGVITTYSIGGLTNKLLSAAKVDNAGTLQWSGPVPLCSINLGKDDVWSGIFASNQVVIVWMDERNGGGIYAQNINDNGVLGATSGINDNTSITEVFNIYPNPSGDLNLFVNSSNEYSLQITDLAGRVIYNGTQSENISSNPISVPNEFSKGIYMVSLSIDNKKYQKLWMRD